MRSQSNNTSSATNCQADQPSWFINFEETVKAEEAAKKEERRQERKETCGKLWQVFIDPTTGDKKSYAVKCGLWRDHECESCFDDRKYKFKMRITRAIERGKSVYAIPITESGDIISELAKEDYLRLPADMEGEGLLFYNATKREKVGIQILSMNAISENVWDLLTNTPEGSRPSGDLGKEEENESDFGGEGGQEKVEINITSVTINTEDKAKSEQAWTETLMRTTQLNPKTPQEVEEAIATRMAIFQACLQKREVEIVKVSTITRKLIPSDISWSIYQLNAEIGNKSGVAPPF